MKRNKKRNKQNEIVKNENLQAGPNNQQPNIIVKTGKSGWVSGALIFLSAIIIFAGIKNFKPLANLWNNIKTNVLHIGEEDTTNEVLSIDLSELSELATVEAQIEGTYKWTNGKIPLLTKKGFTMEADVVVKAGIDTEAVTVEVVDDIIMVTLPHAQVFSSDIDMDSVTVKGKKHALFNHRDDNDLVYAFAYLQDQSKEQAIGEGILQQADLQAENAVRKLLAPVSEGRRIFIEFADAL